ncbi:hypothetical protein NQ176_g5850 [Zarea fungicola]|uniref:Uncharacterized protein n=1 Tax=Zarea fungicola TaxID=93591 RepID=A0ACC1N6V8_9HYPO|nr:hypothetical protein NQ176_g5850 [Lecanicillium fungicola]
MRIICPGPRTGAFFVHAKADAGSPSQVSHPLAGNVHDALMRMPPPPVSAVDACRADAFDQLFVSHFIDSFGLRRNTATGPTWLERLPALLSVSGGSVLSRASIRSASMLSYGTWAHDEAVRTESFRWYASALAQLSLSIAEGKLSNAGTVEMRVCAAVMLIHFETWAGTSHNAWLHHVKGAASLLEAAGPEACRKGFMQSVFSHMRFQIFIATMHENKLHAFAEDRWLDIPFRDQGKTFFDELVDALFLVQQCLFVTQKQIELLQAKNKEAAATVKNFVINASRLLSEWHVKYAPFLQSSFFIEISRQIDAASLQSTALSHSNNPQLLASRVPEASLISLFHAARLIIAQISSATTAGVPDTAEDDTRVILCATDFVSQYNSSGPGSKLRPFMMLPGLKIVSLWSPLDEARTAALAQLLDHKFLNSPMADIALTPEGYFSMAAKGILNIHREFL